MITTPSLSRGGGYPLLNCSSEKGGGGLLPPSPFKGTTAFSRRGPFWVERKGILKTSRVGWASKALTPLLLLSPPAPTPNWHQRQLITLNFFLGTIKTKRSQQSPWNGGGGKVLNFILRWPVNCDFYAHYVWFGNSFEAFPPVQDRAAVTFTILAHCAHTPFPVM